MKEKDYLFGIRPIIEAIDSGKEINKILIQKGLNTPVFRELSLKIKPIRHLVQYVPLQKLNRVTRKNHQGVIAFISPVTYSILENLLPGIYENGEIPMIIILDRITDVRNFGAIARTAECMGAHAIVIPEKGSVQINGDAVKASAGALTRLPVCRVRFLQDSIDYLKGSGIRVIGCSEKAKKAIHEEDFTVPTCIVMGSEEDGISPSILDLLDEHVGIPMAGHTASLNVSVASGMILYESLKQRQA